MKYRLLVLLLPVMILLASCTGEEDEGLYAIGFQTSGNTMLRASDIDAGNILDFRVWTVWTRDALPVIYMDGIKVERIDNQSPWMYSPVFYWPTAGTLDFYAYSPATSTGVLSFDAENLSLIYDVTTDHQRQEDFVMASILEPAFNSPVNLNFEHMLSQVKFHVKSKREEVNLHIKKIELTGLYRQGTLVGTPSAGVINWIWDDRKIKETYAAYMPLPVVATSSGFVSLTNSPEDNLMILPQTVLPGENLHVVYDVYSSSTNTLIDREVSSFHSLSPAGEPFVFEPGQKYSFYLGL